MNDKCVKIFSHAKPTTVWGKILQFPITRILAAVLFLAPISVINNLMAIYVVEPMSAPYSGIITNILNIVYFFLFLYAYRMFARFIEKREAFEISKQKSVNEVGSGFLIGLILVTIMVVLLAALNYYQIEEFNSWTVIINAFFLFGMGAFVQELLIRAVVFRIIEEYLGSWISMFIVASLFGIIHLLNENATILTTIALLVSDVLLLAAFIYTRRLWLVWGIHFGWNFFQDGIFGMPNSGISTFPSWIKSTVNGPEWITGGNFGIESSLIAILLSVAVGIVILKKAWDNDLFVTPYWKR